MILTREESERREPGVLAPYAQLVSAGLGREHDEPPHPFRTDYQRDRARVVHSRAFRRLEHKTQVLLGGAGDHQRNRLTHTMEVASVSRAIAHALALNEDLAEAIALSHDLGHAPYGHAGEEALNRLMTGHGGFEHNAQSLRVVKLLETSYPGFRGMNLTFEVLEGLRKHDAWLERPATGGVERYRSPSLEAQVVDFSDAITYYCHDLDDGLMRGLITEKQVAGLKAWGRCANVAREEYPDLEGPVFCAFVVRSLLDSQVEDVVRATDARLRSAGIESVEDVRSSPDRLVVFSDGMRRANAALRKFLYADLYFHSTVVDANRRGCEMIETVFQHYLDHPERLGRRTSALLPGEGLPRTVCDYVSGMTDRFLENEYREITGNSPEMPESGI